MSMAQGVALITRSTGVVGRETALQLADDGFDIALSDDASEQSDMSALEREIQAKGARVQTFVCDLLKEESIKNVIRDVVHEMGGLDVMFVNPLDVSICFKPFVNISTDEWDKVFDANTRPVFLCYKHAAAQMIKQGRGGRLVTSSGVGMLQALFPNTSALVAALFAIRGLTQTAALELGPHNITVNVISHGFLENEDRRFRMGQELYDQQAQEFSTPDKNIQTARDQMFHRVPLPQKAVSAQDVARVVRLVASKDCNFMTGQAIAVNGGIVMH